MASLIQYGLEFPKDTNQADIHLNIWRHYDEYESMSPELLPRHLHMKKAIEILFPEYFIQQAQGYEVRKRGYIWNHWMERRCWSWSNRDYQTWWGPSASGKSTDAAILALCTWLASPSDTTIIVCSTTKPMLAKRIWREVVKFYKMRENQFPGKLIRSDMAIYFDPENPLSGIHGVAVKRGSIEDALGDMIGMHNEYVYLIIDEMQSTHEAAGTAWDNLSSGKIDGGFLGMGNPMSKLDPLGAASEPVAGWKTISTESKEWKTKKGWCLYFNGEDSPGVRDPVRFPFLLTQKQIDDMAEDPGKDSPRYWTMRRGFLPPDGLVWAVMNENAMVQYGVQDEVDFVSRPVRVAGIDPAYSQGGDKCIVYPADVGMTNTGDYAIKFLEPVPISLAAREGELMLQTLRSDIIKTLRALDIDISHAAIDTTGNQWMLADSIEENYGETGLLRVKFTGSATDDALSIKDPRPAKDLYVNYVTELWGRFGIYVTNNMIRNLSAEACKQFCIRQLNSHNKDLRKVVIEPKELLRERIGYSPDEADAAALAVEVVRRVLGILPMTKEGAEGTKKVGTLEQMALAEQKMLEEDDFSGDEFDAVGDSDGFDDMEMMGV